MGIVYVLTNESMPGLIKIGITGNDLAQRMLSLDNTSVPLPFECYYAAEVPDAAAAERALHTAFGDHRIRHSREFFQLDPFRAKAVLELLAIEDVTPRESVVETADDGEAIQRIRGRRPRFRFSMAGIPIGAVLTFSRDPQLTAQVIDDTTVSFRGEETSVSASALTIMRELGYDWTTVSGTELWLYEDRTLWEHRMEVESRSDADS